MRPTFHLIKATATHLLLISPGPGPDPGQISYHLYVPIANASLPARNICARQADSRAGDGADSVAVSCCGVRPGPGQARPGPGQSQADVQEGGTGIPGDIFLWSEMDCGTEVLQRSLAAIKVPKVQQMLAYRGRRQKGSLCQAIKSHTCAGVLNIFDRARAISLLSHWEWAIN